MIMNPGILKNRNYLVYALKTTIWTILGYFILFQSHAFQVTAVKWSLNLGYQKNVIVILCTLNWAVTE